MSRDLRRLMSAKAEEAAVQSFGRNLEQLLLQRPLGGIRVLGVDPGFRSGAKLAAVDETGKVPRAASYHLVSPHTTSTTSYHLVRAHPTIHPPT